MGIGGGSADSETLSSMKATPWQGAFRSEVFDRTEMYTWSVTEDDLDPGMIKSS